MCDASYRLLWWPLAPYAEQHDPTAAAAPTASPTATERPASLESLGVDGLLLSSLDTLFNVCICIHI